MVVSFPAQLSSLAAVAMTVGLVPLLVVVLPTQVRAIRALCIGLVCAAAAYTLVLGAKAQALLAQRRLACG
jgi:hypothetical protein